MKMVHTSNGKAEQMAIVPYTKAGKTHYRAEFQFKGVRYTQAGFPTKRAASGWRTKEKERLENEGANPSPKNQPPALMFSEACEKYLKDCSARMQPGTYQEKFRHLEQYALFIEKDCPVSALGEHDPEKFIADIQSAISDGDGNPLLDRDGNPRANNNKTANRYLRTLKAFWNWTARRHAVGVNPFMAIIPYPEDEVITYVPPTDDVLAVLRAAEDWERQFLSVLVKTAARPGEVRTLQWEHVDFTRSTVTLWTRKRKGGAREYRTINMTKQLHDMLFDMYQDRSSETYVFVNPETGSPFTRQSRPYKYLMERLIERAEAAMKAQRPESADTIGIKPFTFRSFRNYVAAKLRDAAKASRYEIQALLGHKRSDTTDRYLKSLSPDLAEPLAALDTEINFDQFEKPRRAKVIKITRL